ncbi:MAG: phosphoglyceromutase [Chloroflexi bacterium]|nr:phosphoglyceromutase [Chloroflexota bacterium]
MSSLVLVRHGKSLWNLENRFTGWTDIDLSEDGIKEAELAGKLLLEKKLKIHLAYSSIFRRAFDTGKIILDKSKNNLVVIKKDWRLNERHYGDLQGLNKAETSIKYGNEQLLKWRRSFNTKPPKLNDRDYQLQFDNPLFKDIPKEGISRGESLKDTVNRVKFFYNEIIIPTLESQKNILIAAHGNSIRALTKIIENLSEKSVEKVEIQTGIPIIYLYKNHGFLKDN